MPTWTDRVYGLHVVDCMTSSIHLQIPELPPDHRNIAIGIIDRNRHHKPRIRDWGKAYKTRNILTARIRTIRVSGRPCFSPDVVQRNEHDDVIPSSVAVRSG